MVDWGGPGGQPRAEMVIIRKAPLAPHPPQLHAASGVRGQPQDSVKAKCAPRCL